MCTQDTRSAITAIYTVPTRHITVTGCRVRNAPLTRYCTYLCLLFLKLNRMDMIVWRSQERCHPSDTITNIVKFLPGPTDLQVLSASFVFSAADRTNLHNDINWWGILNALSNVWPSRNSNALFDEATEANDQSGVPPFSSDERKPLQCVRFFNALPTCIPYNLRSL